MFKITHKNKVYLQKCPLRERVLDSVNANVYEPFDNDGIEIIYFSSSDSDIVKELKSLFKDSPKPKSNYFYLITFTLKQDYTPSEIDKIEAYIHKQFLRPALQIKNAYISKELTKNNRPHWHVAVESSKYIAKDRFDYYVKKYGFIDISKSYSQTLKNSITYIEKEGRSLKLV